MPASMSECRNGTFPAAHGGIVTTMRVMCGIGVSRSSVAWRARSCTPSSIEIAARAGALSAPAIADSARSTASSVGITCASRRASELSPLRTSSPCSAMCPVDRSAR